jgi:hypothetical protein
MCVICRTIRGPEMLKIQVSVTTDQYEYLRYKSVEKDCSINPIVRKALEEYIVKHPLNTEKKVIDWED